MNFWFECALPVPASEPDRSREGPGKGPLGPAAVSAEGTAQATHAGESHTHRCPAAPVLHSLTFSACVQSHYPPLQMLVVEEKNYF